MAMSSVTFIKLCRTILSDKTLLFGSKCKVEVFIQRLLQKRKDFLRMGFCRGDIGRWSSLVRVVCLCLCVCVCTFVCSCGRKYVVCSAEASDGLHLCVCSMCGHRVCIHCV